jgi:hypothetical protein
MHYSHGGLLTHPGGEVDTSLNAMLTVHSARIGASELWEQ